MRFVTYHHMGKTRLGVLFDGLLIDLQKAHELYADYARLTQEQRVIEKRLFSSMRSLLAGGQDSLELARKTLQLIQKQAITYQDFSYAFEDVDLHPPVIAPGKIICVGMNYPPPGTPSLPPQYPVLFLKATSTLTGHRGTIQLPRASQDVFCEGELAVVIGRRGKHIPREEALLYIAGYTIANDVGARDLEARSSQWATGKLPDTFSPMGPALVTRDEVPDPSKLTIRTYVNEQLVQDGSTGDMIFNVPYLVSYLSGITTLEPGDIILTGSPKAVGERPAPKVSLRPGDTIKIEIETLGLLTNTAVAEE